MRFLFMKVDGQRHAVFYATRSLSDTERRKSQTEKEALALVWSCKSLNLYLCGLPEFELVPDHEAPKPSRAQTLNHRYPLK